jgi:hypothetical protein
MRRCHSSLIVALQHWVPHPFTKAQRSPPQDLQRGFFRLAIQLEGLTKHLPCDQLPENDAILQLEIVQDVARWYLSMQHRLVVFIPHMQEKIPSRVILCPDAYS